MPEAGGAGRSGRPTGCLSDLALKDPDPQDRRSGGDAPKLQAGGRSWAVVSSVRRKQCFHRPALHLAIPGPARPARQNGLSDRAGAASAVPGTIKPVIGVRRGGATGHKAPPAPATGRFGSKAGSTYGLTVWGAVTVCFR